MKATVAIAVFVSLAAQAGEGMMPVAEGNKAVVRRVFEEAVNQGRFELLDELIAEDYAGANSGATTSGRAAFLKPLRALKEAFPDLHYHLEEVIAEGDSVVVHWHWTGTHRGTYHGPGGTYPPTGKSISNEGVALFEVREGKVQRGRVLTDRLGFLQEVGAAPKPPTAK
jgi:steroid delta-isomerase-like uncharacterized protein